MIVTFTIFPKTEGGPSLNVEDMAVDVAAAAMLRCVAFTATGTEAADLRAALKRQEDIIIDSKKLVRFALYSWIQQQQLSTTVSRFSISGMIMMLQQQQGQGAKVGLVEVSWKFIEFS